MIGFPSTTPVMRREIKEDQVGPGEGRTGVAASGDVSCVVEQVTL